MLKATEASVQTFNSAQFGTLRTQTMNGQILFCLADVAKALGLEQISRLKERLKGDGVTTSKVIDNLGRIQEAIFIDEPNLYRCIFQSRKKEAETFQDWVFEEVLPAIRQNGGYVATHQNDTPEMIMARALQVAQATIDNHRQRLQMLEAERDHYQGQVKGASKGCKLLYGLNVNTTFVLSKHYQISLQQ